MQNQRILCYVGVDTLLFDAERTDFRLQIPDCSIFYHKGHKEH